MIIKMFKELGKRLDEQSEELKVLSKEFKNIYKKNQRDEQTITEI